MRIGKYIHVIASAASTVWLQLVKRERHGDEIKLITFYRVIQKFCEITCGALLHHYQYKYTYCIKRMNQFSNTVVRKMQNSTLAAVGDDAGPSAVMTTQLPRLS